MSDDSLKQYLEERFKNMNEKLDFNFQLLYKDIVITKEHATRTNGRVTRHDKRLSEVTQDLQILDHKVVKLKAIQENCPINDVKHDINKLEEKHDTSQQQLADVHFFIRHPKLASAILAGSVLINLLLFLGLVLKLPKIF